tara:strand:+ start:1999 stop:2694 length:696 start_codon:yes stop_codon:yes gene_type:complete
MLNFILFKDLPLLYGRVPKVANSSIKASLSRLLKTAPQEGIRTTSDHFWKTGTNGETSMLSNHEARMLRGTHFSFSFVRNPFDRLVSAYNNKLLELATIPERMKAMGLRHSMPFGDFLEVVASTRDDDLDVHLLPQSSILCLNGELIPNFIGHLETMQEDWIKLQQELNREGLPKLGRLPEKNVRRNSDHRDVPRYFQDSNLVRLVSERYGNDLSIFYGNHSNEQLIKGDI